MRQRLFSLAVSFRITDESGHAAYYAKGESFRIGSALSLQDTGGKELIHIDQRPFKWAPTYELWRDGGMLALVERVIHTFQRRFTISVDGANDLEANGNFLDREYVFSRRGQAVALLTRRWFAFTPTSVIEINTGEDDALILACAIVVDLVCRRHNTTFTIT